MATFIPERSDSKICNQFHQEKAFKAILHGWSLSLNRDEGLIIVESKKVFVKEYIG